MNLIIVESPAKSKTIEKFLGRDYKVLASFGHVRDLPQKELGIDVKSNYDPTYVVSGKAKKIISDIKRVEKEAKILYLATDLDREGEAISWHLLKALKIKDNDVRVKRIVFNEITKTAIENAIKNPRTLDMNLVDAQQARRILDRLVGYKLSPLLWKKVKSGLSAGRVQSVTVRLVVEREREIEGFKPKEFWVLGVNLSKINNKKIFKAFLTEAEGKAITKYDINSEKLALGIEKDLVDASYKVLDVVKRESKRNPAAPFTTSTLQMEASRKLGFSAKATMSVAQKLYESGHITYMRTDSTNLSSEALSAARKTIESDFGKEYLPEKSRVYQTKAKRAQEAHEAIRPSHFENRKVSSDSREQRLYDLIWKRTIASQMKEAIYNVIDATIEAKNKKVFKFLAKGESLKFDGFIKVYTEGKDDESEEEVNPIPPLVKDEILDFHDLIKDQKFTEPPKRYTEATLVKKLEGLGIGRPSTYAPTLSTIQDRGYVSLIDKRFQPSEIGKIVNDLLVEHFSEVVDYKFTANMEDSLDEVAEGKRKWVPVIDDFYQKFEKNLKIKTKEIQKDDVMKPEATDEKCPECGQPLVIKLGRYGKFMACSGYPECKFSKPLAGIDKGDKVVGDDDLPTKVSDALEEKCEKCGGKMILKEGRFGKFLACENYPKCKNTKAIVSTTGLKCPECGEGELVEKRTKRGKLFWGCSRYPGCKYGTWENPLKDKESGDGSPE